MQRDYDLLIFDWDGTLADSVGRIVLSMRAAALEGGLEVRDDMAGVLSVWGCLRQFAPSIRRSATVV
ncbi:HAD-superfamily hydrolase [Pseudomonas syringae pv. coriandricola]|uniref:HAD-superfamily hydrolase n=1 Tax=Pseudomonas syringae pv. coriandricola TaxID=264453 RepID=A0A3M5RA26_9PSED|nr:HAD-superfamily hydrolase [Pseudomonas syringae pv. coriandricola]